MECTGKGKVRQPYELGVKVTVATTHKDGLVVGMRTMRGNPYDGHTLAEAVEQVSILTDHSPKAVFVGKGYRGVTPGIKKAIHQRNAIEPGERLQLAL